MRLFSFFLFLVGFLGSVYSQETAKNFSVKGTVNCISGKARLIGLSGASYSGCKDVFNAVDIVNNKYTLKGSIAYPIAVTLRIDSAGQPIYMSGVFYITSGFQEIVCDISSSWEVPAITNAAMQEYEQKYLVASQKYKPHVSALAIEIDSLYSRYGRNLPDSVTEKILLLRKQIKQLNLMALEDYVNVNKFSYLGMWLLLKELKGEYHPMYDGIFQKFSSNIVRSALGRDVDTLRKKFRLTAIAAKFPKVQLVDSFSRLHSVPSVSRKKLVLVDFWFSHCNPCISQFPELKLLYDLYYTKGFDVVAISVDGRKHLNDWKQIMVKYNLPWQQYLDVDGKFANRLGIESYPTNFLLDEKGEIVRRDISMDELRKMLQKL
jgi:thiol-disulfide isomerase/thioredoxin